MGRSITERLQHLYAAFAAGGCPAGPRAFRVALQSLHDSFEYCSLEMEQMIERGDEVVVVARVVGRGKVSGVPIDHRFDYVWTTRNGRIVRFERFVHVDEALSEGDIGTVLDLLDPDVEIRDRPEAPE